jgi:hypothetical protein
MNKLKLFILVMALGAFCAQSMAKDNAAEYNYELTRAGVPGVKSRDPNFVIFVVYSYGKKEKVTTEVCKRNAIHGVLFKGLPAEDGMSAVPALLGSDTYEVHKDYFDDFFKSSYLQYLEETNKGMHDVMKLKKEYKIGMKVRVNLKALKERLRQDKILADYKELFM